MRSDYNQVIGAGEELCFDENHGSPPYKVGGPLFIRRFLPESGSVGGSGYFLGSRILSGRTGLSSIDAANGDWHNVYSGGLNATTFAGFTELPSGSERITKPEDVGSYANPDDMQDLGSRAYNKLRPKVEKLNLAQSIIEARDIPKMLKTTAKGFAYQWHSLLQQRDLGGRIGRYGDRMKAAKDYARRYPGELSNQFLNSAFGWGPFLRDLSAIYDTVTYFEKYRDRAVENNGKTVKRFWTEDDIQSSNQVYGTSQTGGTTLGLTPILGGSDWRLSSSKSTYGIWHQIGSQTWYEGRFRAYYPEFDSGLEDGYPQVRALRQGLRLFGANIDPITVWKVTPWSWLADWAVNVGDNVQRFQDIMDNSVASEYFYLMRHTVHQYQYRSVNALVNGQSATAISNRSVEVSRRTVAASPFSFSLLPGGLSGMQLMILAALGLSRFS